METKIEGIVRLESPAHADERGFFKEVLRFGALGKETGKSFIPKQVNHAHSTKNTLRGIHVAPWNKIIYVVKGKVQVVIVDCRTESANYGKYESFMLGDDNRMALFVPAGLGNSYLVLSEEADYVYITDEEWSPGREKDVRWNDKDLNINWQTDAKPFLSKRDQESPPFSAIFPKS